MTPSRGAADSLLGTQISVVTDARSGALVVAAIACFVLAGAFGIGGGPVFGIFAGLGVALLILAATRRLVYHGRFPR